MVGLTNLAFHAYYCFLDVTVFFHDPLLWIVLDSHVFDISVSSHIDESMVTSSLNGTTHSKCY